MCYYIPNRLSEGYGVNREAVEELARQGVRLMITVDCGITAVEEVAYASGLGIDVIITDHHECKEEIPAAVAVVDPHRKDCPYPFKDLAGVGWP
ncbi:MAG: DHH family phosphoesterase [Evtepia gabavorous]